MVDWGPVPCPAWGDALCSPSIPASAETPVVARGPSACDAGRSERCLAADVGGQGLGGRGVRATRVHLSRPSLPTGVGRLSQPARNARGGDRRTAVRRVATAALPHAMGPVRCQGSRGGCLIYAARQGSGRANEVRCLLCCDACTLFVSCAFACHL